MKKSISVNLASRVRDLPPYLFASIDKMKRQAIGRGADLIDLSIGDPDIPTPRHIVNTLKKRQAIPFITDTLLTKGCLRSGRRSPGGTREDSG